MTYTTLEQSKALVKLGLDGKTADLTIISDSTTPHIHIKGLKRGTKEYPCWSAEALLDIIPKHICTKDGKDYSLVIEKTDDDIAYFIGYHDVDMLRYEYVIEETGELIPTLFKIIEWLLTYKLI